MTPENNIVCCGDTDSELCRPQQKGQLTSEQFRVEYVARAVSSIIGSFIGSLLRKRPSLK